MQCMKIFQKDVHVINERFDDQKIWLTKENSGRIRKDREKISKFNQIESYLKNQEMIILMQLKKRKINHERIFWTTQKTKKYFEHTNTRNLEMLKNYHLFHIMIK